MMKLRLRSALVPAREDCLHLTPIPVHAHLTGELVARLCPDCDAQLPAEEPPVDWMNTFAGWL